MDKEFTDLYDDYIDGLLERREFLKRLAVIAGGMAAANSLLPLLESNDAMAAIVSPDDPGLTTEYVTYPGKTGGVRAYLAQDMQQSALAELERAAAIAPNDDTVKDWLRRAKRARP